MKRKLLIQACVKFAAGLLLVGCLLFLPAGTIAFWKGWLLMAALFFSNADNRYHPVGKSAGTS